MNPVSREPVLTQALAAVLVWLAARYGLNLSEQEAFQLAGAAVVVLAPFVRQLVTPTAKDAPPSAPTVYVPPRVQDPDRPV